MNWFRYPEFKPEPEEDYSAFTHSKRVMVFDGKKIQIGYLQKWDENEYEENWKQDGPDGYFIEGVTHWADLPEFPIDAEDKNFISMG